MAQTLLGDGNVTASGVVRGDTVRAASLAKYEIGTTTKTSDLSQELAAKQDAISDLSTIRSGASAGATAVQSFSPVGDVTPTVASGVANLSSLFSSANTSLVGVCRYSTAGAITTTTQMADRTVNPVTLTTNTVELTFPAAVTDKVRDFLIYIDASAWTTGTLTITKPTGSDIIGDSFPSITATCKYLVAVTEVTSGLFYVRSIKIS